MTSCGEHESTDGETRNNKETATQKHEIQITSENKRELKVNTE